MNAKSITFCLDETLKKQADEAAKYRVYVLRELAESKKEAMDPHTILEDHADFMREWKTKREIRKNATSN